MRAWAVDRPGPIATHPLSMIERDIPDLQAHQVLVKVRACGVCRTDLHLAEGDLPPRRALVIPGHEAVGTVEQLGPRCESLQRGDRVGVAWLASTCGSCRFCNTGRENLCLEPKFTGWDLDGGFAQYVVADERFVYKMPEGFSDIEAAPLLCAGIIGYRALLRSQLPPGGRIGLYGFGASAHIAAQVARAQGASVHVMTRSPEARELAMRLGAKSARNPSEAPPEPLDSAILFAPVGDLVPSALSALDRGGTLAVAGIHLTDIPSLEYQTHLFEERTLRSVTANTREDGREFLELAARIGLEISPMIYSFEEVNRALLDLAEGRVTGVAVVSVEQ